MRALLLVDHGSRSPAAHATLAALAEQVRAQCPGVPVGIAHLEQAPPDIPAGLAALAAAGATAVQVLSCFLAEGRHVREDVPRIVAQSAQALGITATVAPPIGPHPLLARLLLLRAGLLAEPPA